MQKFNNFDLKMKSRLAADGMLSPDRRVSLAVRSCASKNPAFFTTQSRSSHIIQSKIHWLEINLLNCEISINLTFYTLKIQNYMSSIFIHAFFKHVI